MLTMEKTIKIVGRTFLLAAMSCVQTSCHDLLDEKPYTAYDADRFFVSTTNLEMATLGVYESLSHLNTYGQSWMVFNGNTDETQITAGDPAGSNERMIATYYKILPNNARIEQFWQLYYQGIDRANLVVERGEEVPVENDADAKLKNRFIAEARFLRGLYYFDLVRLFGDVPLKTTYSKPNDNFMVPRSDRELVYDQIIEDMSQAIDFLPWADEIGNKNARITKGASLGFLARVYLFRGGYSLNQEGVMQRPANYKYYYKKAEECIERIDVTKHKLNSSFEALFKNFSTYVTEPKESMFEIEFFNPSGSSLHAGFWGTYTGLAVHQSSKYGRANSFIKTTKLFYDKFDQGDLRRDISVCTYSIDALDQQLNISEKSNNSWNPGKWRRTWMSGSVKDLNNTDVNFCLIRYADVLLMDAEIKNELHGGPTDAAFESVNKVRRRAFGKPVDTPSNIDLDQTRYGDYQSFLEYIQLERSRELSFELARRHDLIRWNLLKKATDQFKADMEAWRTDWNARNPTNTAGKIFYAADYFTTGKHELFPIPDRERRESGYVVSQNPGYE